MNRISILLVSILFSANAIAQKFQNEKGDLSVLKGQPVVNVVFKYDKLRLFNDYRTEEQYVKTKTEDLNKKEDGLGDIWQKKWEKAKESIWQSNFFDLLLKTATRERKIAFKENANDAKYTLIVDAIWIYPGWDAAVMKKKAKVTTNLKIVETQNPENIVYQVDAVKAPGDQWGNNFSNESRIGEGFEKTAKSFGKLIIKRTK
ncbi:MAG: hypothetical protein Q3983_07755 [Capnocytophaga sp.]|nr:hypothetical protein [Capnocytophaga sp.]